MDSLDGMGQAEGIIGHPLRTSAKLNPHNFITVMDRPPTFDGHRSCRARSRGVQNETGMGGSRCIPPNDAAEQASRHTAQTRSICREAT